MQNNAQNIFQLDLSTGASTASGEATAVMQLDVAPETPVEAPAMPPPETFFTGSLVHTIEAEAAPRKPWLVYAAVAILVIAGSLLIIDESTKTSFLTIVTGETPTEALPPRPKRKPIAAQPAAAEDNLVANPYWNLPNPNSVAVPPQMRTWSRDEETQWSRALKDQRYYQRAKAIEQVRQNPLEGNALILKAGLDQKKFWTRMSAALGLAERGIVLTADDAEKIVASTRDSLIRNYLERFQRPLSEAEKHVLRHLIKLVDAPARQKILQGLVLTPDPLTDLILVAAQTDPDSDIQNFASQQIKLRQVAAPTLQVYREAVASRQPVAESILAPSDIPQQSAAAEVKKAKVISVIEYSDEELRSDVELSNFVDTDVPVRVIEVK